MYIVAIVRLATDVAAEAAVLAAQLGTTLYDEKLKLSAGLPAIVMQTPELDRATAVAAAIRLRGHGVIMLPAADVVPASAMVGMRRFGVTDAALIANDPAGSVLPWGAIAALVRATHRVRSESSETVKSKQFSIGLAVATGGLLRNKSVTKEVVTRTAEIEPVMYVFARGRTPWLLREGGTHFGALGARIAPTALRNFALTVEMVRARASAARFDERLVQRRATPGEIDVLAHLIASAG